MVKHNILISIRNIQIITFIVALCSIVYELILAQTLTVLFGGTVLRYSMTIGLFLLSLGIGSYYYKYLKKKKKEKNFFYLEIILSIIGPASVFLIILVNGFFPANNYIEHLVLLVTSHIPIILIGFLSGIELPLLADLNPIKEDSFSSTLSVDYLGSLVGTILFSLYLYPELGLFLATLIIGFLNLIAAIYFLFNNKIFKSKNFKIIISSIILLIYFISFIQIKTIQNNMEQIYYGDKIKQGYKIYDLKNLKVNIDNVYTTQYQNIIFYTVHFNSPYYTDVKCMNLDSHVQMCTDWVVAYHHGLVDTSMAFFNQSIRNKTKVLIVGGGDWIPANFLKKYNVSIDLVDIDKKFTNIAKKYPLLEKYNNDSFNYKRLNVTYEDGFAYLKNNKKKYDLILVDIPGIKHDKLLHLYSKEFYRSIYDSLSDKGLFVTWGYYDDQNNTHSKVLFNTYYAAGFKNVYRYDGYDKSDTYVDDFLKGDKFFALSKNNYKPKIDFNSSIYMNYIKNKFAEKKYKWKKIKVTKGVKVNSIFNPNFDIIIKEHYY